MKINKYKKMVDKMDMPKEMDQRLQSKLFYEENDNKKMVDNRMIKRFSVVAAVVLIIFGLFQIPMVSDAAAGVLNYFKYSFSFSSSDGKKETVYMKTEYITFSKEAPTRKCKMNSIDEVSNKIGITLLNNKGEKTEKDVVTYNPSVSEKGKLKGVLVQNHCYYYGDITNVITNKEYGTKKYESGGKYKTPIGVQISLRSNEDLKEKYVDNEIGYVAENQNVDLDNTSSNTEVYELTNLDVKAVLFTDKTDGPMAWGLNNQDIECTTACFVHKGVEYVYYGGVSHDTMKEFLDTLK